MTAATRSPQRLQIDWTRCDGHGLCHALAPELVDLDEWGFPVVHDTAGADEPQLRRLAAACPALALHVTAAHTTAR